MGGDGIEADDQYDAELDVMDKFWVKKAMAQGLVDYGNEQDVWWGVSACDTAQYVNMDREFVKYAFSEM